MDLSPRAVTAALVWKEPHTWVWKAAREERTVLGYCATVWMVVPSATGKTWQSIFQAKIEEDSVGLLCNCLVTVPSAGKTWQSTFQVKVGLFSYCQI